MIKPSNRIFLYFLFFIPVVVLIVMKNYAYYWDGISYAINLENLPIEHTFHRHHLVYTPFCYAIYLVISKIGISMRSIDFLIILNIIFGLIYLTACFLIFKMIFHDFPIAAPLGTMFIAISYTFGTYFRNTTPYLIPMAICAVVFLRIISQSRNEKNLRVTPVDWILLFIAVLFHQIALLMLPAVIFAQMMSVNQYRSRIIIRNILIFSISFFGIYLMIFYLTGLYTTQTSFLNWMSGYAFTDFWVFREAKGFLPAIQKSTVESIISHKALFVAPVERSLLRVFEFNRTFSDDFQDRWVGWILFIVIIAFILCGIGSMLRNHAHQRLAKFLLIWILMHIAFFNLFTPYQNFYRMFYLLPLAILMLEGIKKTRWTRVNLTFGIILLLTFTYVNFLRGFVPESLPENNPYLVFSKKVEEKTDKHDLFIFTMFPDYHYGLYLQYFGNRDVFWLRDFQSYRYPGANFEKLWTISQQTRDFINDNYNKLYLPIETIIPKTGCLRLVHKKQLNYDFELLLLMPMQISTSSFNQLGSRYFYEVELIEYKPSLFSPLNDLS